MTINRTYRGYRREDDRPIDTANEAVVLVDRLDGRSPIRLRPTALAQRKSPSGFNWGYGGSGPAALAHSILADALGPDLADAHYQDFKRDVISNLDTPWKLTRDEILCWLRSKS